MKKIWANVTAALMTLTVFAGCNKGTGDNGDIEKPSAPTHTHAYTKEVVASAYLKRQPTCTTKAQYYYSCECGEKGNDFFTVGEARGHKGGTATETEKAVCESCGEEYGELVAHQHVYNQEVAEEDYLATAATCKVKATYYYSCKCGEVDETRTFAYGAPSAHDFTGDWEKDENAHWHVCQADDCDEIDEKLPHSGGTATETDKAVCADCGEPYGQPTSHNHVYDQEVAEEDYLATAATCTTRASYYYSCDCGEADKTRTFKSGGLREHDFESSEWQYDENAHWRECAYDDCDEIEEKKSHRGGAATQEDKAVCIDCQQAYGETLKPGESAHTHVYDQKVAEDAWLATEATCQAPAMYYYSCACGEKDKTRTFEDGEPVNHDFTRERRKAEYLASEATCKQAKTYYYCCQYCDEMDTTKTYEYGDKVQHDFIGEIPDVRYLRNINTCKAPAIYFRSCQWCGLASVSETFAYGEPTGKHTGGTATETQQKICEQCGEPYGETLSHVHTFTKNVVAAEYLKSAATCDKPAEYWMSCPCGEADARYTDETAYFTAGEATGKHIGGTATTTKKAVCEVCGKEYGEVLLSEVTVSSVTEGYTRYDVGTPNARKTEGFGTQFDTCIVEKQNALTDEEWQIQVNALKEMNLQNVRVRFYPEMYERGNDNNDPNSFDISSSNVDFNSLEMQHLYQLLDAFEENGVKVDLSWYGCRTTFNSEDGKVDGSWLGGTLQENNNNWMVAPNKGSNPNEEYAESVAECLNYLINELGYTCINEYSIFPEPDGLYKLTTEQYVAISNSIKARLATKGLSDKLKFSGPASMDIAYEKWNTSSSTWGNTAASFDSNYLQKFVSGGKSVFEKVTVSAYPFTNNTSNAQMLVTAQNTWRFAKSII